MHGMHGMHGKVKGLVPSESAAPELQSRLRGYVVDPVKVADAMVERAVRRVVPPSLRGVAKFSNG